MVLKFFILAGIFFFISCTEVERNNPDDPQSKTKTKVYCGYYEYNPETHFCDSRDNEIYKFVKIGDQTWMAKDIGYAAGVSMDYQNHNRKSYGYGKLYDWETAKRICPSGWHLPSEEEWTELIESAGGMEFAGLALKSKTDWKSGGNGFDDYDFKALPTGFIIEGKSYEGYSNYYGVVLGESGYWWTSNQNDIDSAYLLGMHYDSIGIEYYYGDKSNLNSVRCLQD